MSTSENSEERETPEEEEQEGSEKEYPEPSNQDYLSYYVYQRDWKPTRPLRPIGAMFAGPGPAVVNLPTTIGTENPDPSKTRAPSYKMGQRLKWKDATLIGAGPGAYNISKLTNQGKETVKAPKIGTAKRFDENFEVQAPSPGPAAYDRETGDKCIFPSAPAFSMRQSLRGKKKAPYVPAPNAYTLPSAIGSGKCPYSKGPAFSIGQAERSPGVTHNQYPGPNAYMLPSTDVNMAKSPGFYMGIKTPLLSVDSSSPGPGAYKRHLVKFDKYSTPRCTFGIRHSPYKAMPGFAAEH